VRFGSIRLHYLLAYAIVGAYMPYLPVFLGRDLGMPDWQIGWIAGMYGMAVILSPPIVTYLADRRLSGRTLIGLAYALTGCTLLALAFARGFIPVLLISMAFSMVYTPMFALLDGLTFSASAAAQAEGHPVPPYDRIRVWGSFGFMIPAFVLFFALRAGAASGRAAIFAAAVAAGLGLLCLPLLPRIAPGRPGAPVPEASPGAPVPETSPADARSPGTPVPETSPADARSPGAPVPETSPADARSPGAPVPEASPGVPVPETSLAGVRARITPARSPATRRSPVPETSPGVPVPETSLAGAPVPEASLADALVLDPGAPVPEASLADALVLDPGAPAPETSLADALFLVPDAPVPEASLTAALVPDAAAPETSHLGLPPATTAWDVLRRPPTRDLIIPLGLLFASIAVFYGFYARLVLEVGIDPSWVGLVMNLGVVSELPFMLAAGPLLRRYSLRQLIVFGALCLVVRMVLLAAVADPRVTVASQVLHGPIVVAIYLIPPMYLNLKAPGDARNSVQGLYAMVCFGVARLLGSVAGGYAAGLGLAWTFGLGAVLATTALIWLWLRFFDAAADAALRSRPLSRS
jgi:predicted MFS family arabinose efflux permease